MLTRADSFRDIHVLVLAVVGNCMQQTLTFPVSKSSSRINTVVFICPFYGLAVC
jgi:hypothetical protein